MKTPNLSLGARGGLSSGAVRKLLQTLFLVAALLLGAGFPFATSACAGESRPTIPPEMEQLLKARIDELFPDKPREKLPETTALDHIEAAVGTIGYTPIKALTACTYTVASILHDAAFETDEGLRILVEGWSGDWLLLGRHLSGAEPLDLVGPDRKFPGHNPLARQTFIESWYLLYSSVDYQGIPKGADEPAAAPAADETMSAPMSESAPTQPEGM